MRLRSPRAISAAEISPPLSPRGWSIWLAPLIVLCLSGCGRSPSLDITVSPVLTDGQPARLAVTMKVEGTAKDGMDLRGFSTADVMKVADARASGADGREI